MILAYLMLTTAWLGLIWLIRFTLSANSSGTFDWSNGRLGVLRRDENPRLFGTLMIYCAVACVACLVAAIVVTLYLLSLLPLPMGGK
jgi:hypothetical protein